MTAKGIKPLGYASPPVCTSVSTQSCDWCFHQQKRINRQIQMQDAPLTQLCGMKENNYLAPVSARSQLLERTCPAVHRRVVNQRVLPGELSDLLHDDELLDRFVQVVGNVQIQERGNCFLSFHIVESMVHPASGFDD